MCPGAQRAPTTEVVILAGEYDMARTDDLRTALTGDGTAECVIAEMADVSFLDSSALTVFVEIRAAFMQAGRRLVLHGMRPGQVRVFEITGMSEWFDLT